MVARGMGHRRFARAGNRRATRQIESLHSPRSANGASPRADQRVLFNSSFDSRKRRVGFTAVRIRFCAFDTGFLAVEEIRQSLSDWLPVDRGHPGRDDGLLAGSLVADGQWAGTLLGIGGRSRLGPTVSAWSSLA